MIPNKYGPFCPLGELVIDAPGTSILLSNNIDDGYKADPNVGVSASDKQQYSIAFEDIIINSPPTNAGGLYLVQRGGSKDDPETIIVYIPQGEPPTSIKKFLGGGRLNPNSLGLDADQAGDKGWLTGIIGS